MVWLHILKNCAAKKGTESGVTNPKPDAIILTFFLVKHFSKCYWYIKSSDLSIHTHFAFSNHCICRMPEKENNLNCIPKVMLASEQSNKGSGQKCHVGFAL